MIIDLTKSSLTGAGTELGKRHTKSHTYKEIIGLSSLVELILGLERSQQEDLISIEGNRASRTLDWIYGHWTWGGEEHVTYPKRGPHAWRQHARSKDPQQCEICSHTEDEQYFGDV